MERLEREVRQELSRFGPPGGMPEVLAAWPGSVGEAIAANAWPSRVAQDGTLHVHTSSAVWAFELGHLAPTVLARLREALGETAPKALRFAVGHLPEMPSPAVTRRLPAARKPDAEALQTAYELTAVIDDEELREQVARAAALSLSHPPSDSTF